MSLIFRREEASRASATAPVEAAGGDHRSLGGAALHLGLLTAILIAATWSRPAEPAGLWFAVYRMKWPVVALLLAALGVRTARMDGGDRREWVLATWSFARQILPLLLVGVLAAGALLGRPGHEGLIPSTWVARAVGGDSMGANLVASVAGAFMYFATLTEVPILQGLLGSGMGHGPALALLLAGPALSLPSMLVIRSILGLRRTAAYVALVVVMSTLSGLLYGALVH